jgi:ketosteroid isomerase-like protein
LGQEKLETGSVLRSNGGDSADQLVVDLLQAEAERCQAIGAADRAALDALLDDDLVYVHSTGVAEDKATYVQKSTSGAHRTVERGELDIRVYGDVGLVTGGYVVRVDPEGPDTQGRVVDASGLQVWLRRDGQWRLLAHQGTSRPAPASDL